MALPLDDERLQPDTPNVGLAEYRRRRAFERTPEPGGSVGSEPTVGDGTFVVQQHRARRMHYDFRLGIAGVLVSWAVPKGPSLDPADKRLAVRTEDHPMEYAGFEGVIPADNYGAGEVIVWDRGSFEWVRSSKDRTSRRPLDALERGRIHVVLRGHKLRGRFVLARSTGRRPGSRGNEWLLIKVRDEHARPGSRITEEACESILTGRNISDVAAGAPGEARWSSGHGLDEPPSPPTPDVSAILGPAASLARRTRRVTVPRSMLASRAAEVPDDEGWLYELALEGVRAFAVKRAGRVRLVSGETEGLDAKFPTIARSVARLSPEALVLDGVIAASDAEGRTRRELLDPLLVSEGGAESERLAREVSVAFHAFDALHVDDSSLTRAPLDARKRVLEALLPANHPRIRYVSHVDAEGPRLFDLTCERELGGLVAKRASSAYSSARRRDWLEIRCRAAPRRARPAALAQPALTNLDKVFWPEDRLTKGDMVDFYRMVAPTLVPYLRDRPMVMNRHPDGIHGESFYQKNAGPETPPWARTEPIWSSESSRLVNYLVVDDLRTLLWVVQLGTISLSPWSSRVPTLEHPDFAVIDLDPGGHCGFERVVEVALLVRDVLEELGLRGYPKTSGATGIHVQVPLVPRYSYDEVRTLAEIVAVIAADRRPDLCTIERTVSRRPQDKVYVDYLQNVHGKTVVCAYSLRERPKAPVSTPLRWDEVRPGLVPERFHMKDFAARLRRVGDLWSPMREDLQRIETVLARSLRLRRKAG